MPSGGLRPGAGRPPAEQSRAKDRAARAAVNAKVGGKSSSVDDGDWLTLAREGRKGRAPAWPLLMPSRATPTSTRERALWKRLWSTPQAIGWERTGVDVDVVALYVRYRVEAEVAGCTASVRNLVRQHADSLGLSAPGLRMLRWKIGVGASAKAADPTPESDGADVGPHRPAPGRSARERAFTVIEGGAADVVS